MDILKFNVKLIAFGRHLNVGNFFRRPEIFAGFG